MEKELGSVLAALNDRIAALEEENLVLKEMIARIYEPAKLITDTVEIKEPAHGV